MTEITRVPLQPIGKGILSKLWIGIVIAVLLAAGAAWASRYQGLEVTTLSAGTGDMPTLDDIVIVNYEGRLDDGTVFDSAEGAVFPVQGVVPGFRDGLQQMQKGGRYELFIPSDMGYGSDDKGVIPPNSDLTFTVELVDFKSEAEVRALQQQMQAMGLGSPGAAPGGMPGSAPEGAAAQ